MGEEELTFRYTATLCLCGVQLEFPFLKDS